MPSTRKKGSDAESLARKYLIARGFEILESNFYARYGEIDIIATKDSIYHFIEVKSGSSINPLLKVTPSKLEKIYKTISIYLANHELNTEYCVDVISIFNGEISFYPNVSMQ